MRAITLCVKNLGGAAYAVSLSKQFNSLESKTHTREGYFWRKKLWVKYTPTDFFEGRRQKGQGKSLY